MQTNQINAALFVDFDNVYLSLATRDKVAADQSFRRSHNWLGFHSLRGLTDAIIGLSSRLAVTGDSPWRVACAAPGTPSATAENPLAPAIASNDGTDFSRDDLAEWVVDFVKKQDEAVSLARLAWAAKHQFGEVLIDTDWLGAGSFKKLLMDVALGDLQLSHLSPGFVYDPSLHDKPESTVSERSVATLQSRSGLFFQQYPAIAPLARKISTLTEMPFLTPDQYALLLEELALEVDRNGYSLTRTSKALRDTCNEKGAVISRASINFILTGIQYSGYQLGTRGKESARNIGEALVENTANLCKRAQLVLTEEEYSTASAGSLGNCHRSNRPAQLPGRVAGFLQ